MFRKSILSFLITIIGGCFIFAYLSVFSGQRGILAESTPVVSNVSDNQTTSITVSPIAPLSAGNNSTTVVEDIINGRLTGNIFTAESDNLTVLLVDKSTENLYVVGIDSDKPALKSIFNVYTGKSPGDKIKAGDMKTPEGIYFIQKYIQSGSLNNAIFGGAGAFTLNYPNVYDRNYGKTGYGIWIHGRGSDKPDERTKGCVSLNDKDLNILKNHVVVETPVIISHQLDFLNPSEYSVEKDKYFKMFDDYVASLQNKKYDEFKEYFDESFKDSNGLELKDYLLNLKEATTNKKIQLDVSGLTIFKENNSELMYQYKEFYCADKITNGTRRLYLHKKDDDKYKIIAEEFYPNGSIEVLLYEQINQLIDNWRKSWLNKDIDKYISYYSKSFSTKGMNLVGWKRYKQRVFEKSTIKDISINDLTIVYDKNTNEIFATFNQRYVSNSVDDKGVKTLIVEGCPGNFKIKAEEWGDVKELVTVSQKKTAIKASF